ncbi:UNVERIFIED_CONTAM: Copia protein, partial [Sesamum calycinum]
MTDIPYTSVGGSIQYVVHCTKPDITYALSVISRYQACIGEEHWSTVKTILKYLKRTKNMFLIYGCEELILEGYNDTSFQSDDDDAKSQSGFVFKLSGGVVASKSAKQATTTDSTIETEYIAASKAAEEAVWTKKLHPRVGCDMERLCDLSGSIGSVSNRLNRLTGIVIWKPWKLGRYDLNPRL